MSKRNLQQRLEALVEEMVAGGIRFEEAQQQLERLFLRRVMDRCDGNQSRAASVLGVHRNTLRNKLIRHGLL